MERAAVMNRRAARRKGAVYGLRYHLLHIVHFEPDDAWVMTDAVMWQNVLAVATRHKLHAPILERRLLERNPDAQSVVVKRWIPVGLILMPWRLDTGLGRFADRMVARGLGCRPQQLGGDRGGVAAEQCIS